MKTVHRGLTAGIVLTAALALLPFAGAQTGQDAAQELQTIARELKQEQKDLNAAARQAADDAAREALYVEFQTKILPEFAERYAAVARANKGTDLAQEGWTKLLGLVPQGLTGPLTSEALGVLTKDHLQSEGLASLASNLRYDAQRLDEETVTRALHALAEGSPHRKVQAAALYSLGTVLGEDRPAGDPRVAEAKAVMAKLAAYGDVKVDDSRSYADAAAAFVFVLENLGLGHACPDFTALDAEGAAFKLSDYKGKVVMVDFWGFW